MRISLITGNLQQGGAQRSAVLLSIAFQNAGHEVELLVLDSAQNDFFKVPSSITVRRVELSYPEASINQIYLKRTNILRLAKCAVKDFLSVRKLINTSKADIYLAIESHVGVLIGLALTSRKPLIISERVHPQFYPIVGLLRYFQKHIYRSKNVFLHAQGSLISDWVSKRYVKNVRIIANFVPRPLNVCTESRTQTVISIGRYAWQKGTDLLIEAWSRVPQGVREDWTLLIFGSGDKKRYSSQANLLKVSDSVVLNSEVIDVSTLYETSGIFVSASRYEGFPNALAEAMAHGLPSLTTDNPSAVRELTKDGKLAMLVPIDIDAIAHGLVKLIEDEESRQYFSRSGVEVSNLFSEAIIIDLWNQFFLDILEKFPERKTLD